MSNYLAEFYSWICHCDLFLQLHRSAGKKNQKRVFTSSKFFAPCRNIRNPRTNVYYNALAAVRRTGKREMKESERENSTLKYFWQYNLDLWFSQFSRRGLLRIKVNMYDVYMPAEEIRTLLASLPIYVCTDMGCFAFKNLNRLLQKLGSFHKFSKFF